MSKQDKNLQDEIRNNLESILKSTNPGSEVSLDGEGAAVPAKLQHPNTRSMDFYGVKDELEKEAKKILKSVMEFYVDKKIINKDEYIRAKKQVDEMSLSNILFSLKTCQHAIIKLLEEIDMGSMHPRNFEVLAALNAQLMSVVKHQAAFMVTLEEGYKKVKHDHDAIEGEKQKTEDGTGTLLDSTGETILPLKVRGTKQLMEGLQSNLKKIKTDDINPDEVRLTDPKIRPENVVPPTETQKKNANEGESFQVDDEMFG